jgi:hypothetical protein
MDFSYSALAVLVLGDTASSKSTSTISLSTSASESHSSVTSIDVWKGVEGRHLPGSVSRLREARLIDAFEIDETCSQYRRFSFEYV